LNSVLNSLTEKEKQWLPRLHNPRFPGALSVVLAMRGWDAEDIIEVVNEARKLIPDGILD